MKRIFSLLLALGLVLALAACTTPEPTEAPTDPPLMDESGKFFLHPEANEAMIPAADAVVTQGNARVYYQIFVGSFSDSNGDGIGDLRGIINRMDYLNDGDPNSGLSLGIEGIWLTPIFTSVSYHKYDCNDYYTIDPKFGTEADLKELIDLCHSRNVQVILDLVINHTGTQHPWFKEFRAAHRDNNTESPYYEYYSYSDTRENGRTWSPLQGSSHFYECNFSHAMPELNYDNPVVREEMVKVAKYYLDLGVDGFRFDAAKYIYYGDEPRNADFWLWYMEQLRAIKPDIYTVAEVWDADPLTYPYFASTNCFNFSMSQNGGRVHQTSRGGNVNSYISYIRQYLDNIQAQKSDAMLVGFLSNHDMDRSAGYLTMATGQTKLAANLYLLLPGSPFIYYGEEIGILGSRGGANTDANRRLAMLWGDGDTVKDPEGTDYKAAQANGTVAQQKPNGDSLYNHYKLVISARKAHPEIANGEFTPVKTPGKTGGFISTWEGSSVLVLHNTQKEPVTVELSGLTEESFTKLSAILGDTAATTLEGTTLTIGAQTSVILRKS